MPPKKTTANSNLTARDLELAGKVWQCLANSDTKVDYVKLAELAGFKNSASASACWGPAKKKLINGAKLSSRDMELAGLVWRCFQGGEPKIDYAKFAQVAKFKNASTASACWGPVKKKLLQFAEMGKTDGDVNAHSGSQDHRISTPDLLEVETPQKASTPRSSVKRKRGQNTGEDVADVSTPVPKKRAVKVKSKRASKTASATEHNAVSQAGMGLHPSIEQNDGFGRYDAADVPALPGMQDYFFGQQLTPEDDGIVDGLV